MKKAKIIIPLILLAVLLAFIVPVVIYTVTTEVPPTTEDAGEESIVSVSGAKIYLSIDKLKEIGGDMIGNPITQTTVTLLVVSVVLILLALLVNKSIKKRPGGGQVIVEKLVSMLYGMVSDTMGKHNLKYAPYIGTIFLSSLFCTLLGMTQVFRSATADLSVTLAWALVTTFMVWYANIKNFGFKSWLKGFTEPIVIMTPMNIVSEIAQPVSMAFRHFGNVAGGSVLTALIYGALSILSSAALGWIPGLLGEIPLFQAGIPAVLSLYFDLFSGFVQAFVFSLLTMVYVSSASPSPEELALAKGQTESKED